MTITPFKISIPDAAIADLKERLAMTRWPAEVTADWSRGQPVALVKELADQWLNDFDWRKAEAGLNRHPQFTTEIDGQRIHFVHVKSSRSDALPLILTHGWPSTFTEYRRTFAINSASMTIDDVFFAPHYSSCGRILYSLVSPGPSPRWAFLIDGPAERQSGRRPGDCYG